MTDIPVVEKNIASTDTLNTTAKENKPPKDSTENSKQNVEEQVPQYKPIISSGLQWNFQLPVPPRYAVWFG